MRSQLESGSLIWNPHENKYSFMIEEIQNKFLTLYPMFPDMYPTSFAQGMIGY